MESPEKDQEVEQGVDVTRRNLLVGGGALAAGALLSKAGGMLGAGEAQAADLKTWPWPYVKLDPDETAEIARRMDGAPVGAAVISSVFSQLAEKVGEPYKSFPVDGFFFLAGGVADWGTICGSNSGANTVVNMIIGPKVHGHKASFTMGSNLMHYYSNTKLPVYVPKNPKIDPSKIMLTQSDSPLCHISVGRWTEKSGNPFHSPERKERCARVTATMAYETVKALNAWKDGQYDVDDNKWFAPGAINLTGQQNCTDCHGSDIPTAKPARS
ncbi:MAG: C-GCAxxG-C-C family protein [Desulfurivibrio sp.]|nr:C-GCAxxG-C-C family protein [Desulfurivibrio sp.]